ncbi:MAG: hypothetical protein SGARI_008249 [Bacillariaceae sp.]
MCSKEFKGRHFVGGRFLPPGVATKYNVNMPPYPACSQVMEVTREQIEGELLQENLGSEGDEAPAPSNQTWREEYEAYLEEMYTSEQRKADTSSAASASSKAKEIHRDPEEDSWEVQYARHCAEKEAKIALEDEEKEEESWLLQYAKHCAEKEAKIAQEEATYKKTIQ